MSMKNPLRAGVFAVIFTLLAGIPATSSLARNFSSGENIDFGEISCADFIESLNTSSQEDTGAVLVWLDGYLSGVTGDTELNWSGFEHFAEALGERCAMHPHSNLLDVARKVGID
jgi:acid stress chaperone HdeB